MLLWTYFIALWQLLFALKPYILSWNFGSYIASNIFFNANCTILSSYIDIPSGRILPLSFGIYTLSAGAGLYALFFSLITNSLIFASKFSAYSFLFTLSIPSALLPSNSLWHCFNSSSLIKWYNDVNIGCFSFLDLSAILSNFVSIIPPVPEYR